MTSSVEAGVAPNKPGCSVFKPAATESTSGRTSIPGGVAQTDGIYSQAGTLVVNPPLTARPNDYKHCQSVTKQSLTNNPLSPQPLTLPP